MGTVRPLVPEDLASLAPIHVAAFGHIGYTLEQISAAYETKVQELFLDDAFADHASPSLVYELDGRVVGFVLLRCRPMVFRATRVWMAMTTHLAVEPEARASLAAVELLRAATDGPQDLTHVDHSNPAGRQALRAAGFEQIPGSSLRWERSLRPIAAVARRVGAVLPIDDRFLVAASGRVANLAGPLRKRADPRLPAWPPTIEARALTVEDVIDVGPGLVAEHDLHPDFDDRTVVEYDWHLIERALPNSTIVRTALTSRRGDVIGWYIVEIGRTVDDEAEILQFVAAPGHQLPAMTCMLHDLVERDVVTARGDLPLRLLYDAETLGCRLHSRGATTSVQSADDDLIDVFRRDRAWVSAFEGELIEPPNTVAR